MDSGLAAAWQVHAAIHVRLLDALGEDALEATLAKGKSVRTLFAHTHNVRRQWLEPSAPALAAKLPKLDTKAPVATATLRAALVASGAAVTELFVSAAATEKIKNIALPPAVFLAYLVSHESHHRGQIGYTLKNSGHPLSKEDAYGLWEWRSR